MREREREESGTSGPLETDEPCIHVAYIKPLVENARIIERGRAGLRAYVRTYMRACMRRVSERMCVYVRIARDRTRGSVWSRPALNALCNHHLPCKRPSNGNSSFRALACG